jgi:hypothetical protein
LAIADWRLPIIRKLEQVIPRFLQSEIDNWQSAIS